MKIASRSPLHVSNAKSATVRKIGLTLVVLAAAGSMIVFSLRSLQSDVDVTVARTIEEHRCMHCGHLFNLTIAEATAMRRQHGDILCPVCGKAGAERTHADAVGLVNTLAPPNDAVTEEYEQSDEETPRPATRETTAAPGLTRKPANDE
jgi:hypothetical protein